MPASDIARAKRAAREKVWTILERENAAPLGVHGHIPAFEGAEQTSARLGELDVWRHARVVKANPDRAQFPVRLRALRDGKLLYMAVPRLASLKPFFMVDPTVSNLSFDDAATSDGAATDSPKVGPDEMRPVDLVVCGSVAVNRRGVRVGKGAGYSDIEVALLTEAGLVGPQTTIVTTVHQLQVVDAELPEAEHDFSVDVIVTPTETITCGPPRRPRGILSEALGAAMIREIPVLRNR
ncbi:5-formyltetrahydrofolate cyclo-ligase [Actinoplanes sp. NBRC 103695]|uniref:5-formyltetrahydrofolate cyclo-ligase n=1 Tax=Actinoplanes sp. NBRC 103695 TaxID=3032202 RepID=UPI0024A4E99A|nr:5-formyltetrahydrofolate cyclo-ligase [Actinoplanes sp. NBRC 103695]GLY94612.1 5-formyltetrahydrofolate cyclo-ligase [Actinoplanes sp. NBRC 103695]